MVWEQVLVVLANRRSLHDGIGGEGLGSIVLTCELASEVGVLSEGLEIVSICPVEVGFYHDWLFFVGIGELGAEALEIWILVIPEIDVIFSKITIWVHHIDCKGIKFNILV